MPLSPPVPARGHVHVEARTRASSSAQVSTPVAAKYSPLDSAHVVVVDIETTGLGAQAGITEIGAIRALEGKIVEEFHSMVNPGHSIPRRITAMTGITNEMIKDADPCEVVLPRFLSWVGRADECAPILVAHNAPFDMEFLRRGAFAAGVGWPEYECVDTLVLARRFMPRPTVADHRLGTLAAHFGIVQESSHRALSDARTTWSVLTRILDAASSSGTRRQP